MVTSGLTIIILPPQGLWGLSHESEILFFWKCPLITLLSWPHSPITLSISKMSQVVYTQLDTYPFLPFYREEHDDRLAWLPSVTAMRTMFAKVLARPPSSLVDIRTTKGPTTKSFNVLLDGSFLEGPRRSPTRCKPNGLDWLKPIEATD